MHATPAASPAPAATADAPAAPAESVSLATERLQRQLFVSYCLRFKHTNTLLLCDLNAPTDKFIQLPAESFGLCLLSGLKEQVTDDALMTVN
jgi:hypothetical protein